MKVKLMEEKLLGNACHMYSYQNKYYLKNMKIF